MSVSEILREKPELVISSAALILSIIATFASIYFARTSLRTSVLPTLVFVFSPINGWKLTNVGNGPALNIVVAHQATPTSKWEQPTRLYPLAKEESVSLPWVGHNPDKLSVVYQDAHYRSYTSICDDDLTTVHGGTRLPKWNKDEITPVWMKPTADGHDNMRPRYGG